MTIIVKKITQIIAGPIFLYGLYIVAQGHLSPGGGFAAGSFIAGAFILLVLAYGDKLRHLKTEEFESSLIETLGILFFIITALGALLLSIRLGFIPVFFKNFLTKGIPGNLFSAGIIPLLNIAVGMEVGGALFTIFLEFVIRSSKEGK